MSFKKITQAVTALQQGQVESAVTLFDKHRKELRQPQHLHACIVAYYRVNRFADAEAVLKKLMGRVPLTPQLASLSADIKKAAGDLRGSVVYYRRALKMDSQVPELHYNLALALFELAEIPEATSLLRKAIAARPNYVKAKVLLGRCLAGQEQYIDAQRELSAASELEPKNYSTHYRKGRLHLHRGQRADAAASLQKSLQLNPSLTAAEELLILSSIRAGDLPEAATQIESTLARRPDDDNLIALATDWGIETGVDNPFDYYQKSWSNQPRSALFTAYMQRLVSTDSLDSAELLLNDYESRFGHDLRWETEKLRLLLKRENYPEMLSLIRASADKKAHAEQQCMAQFALGDYGDCFDCTKQLHLDAPRDQYYLALLTTAMRCLGDARYRELVDYNKLLLEAQLQTQQPSFADANRDLIDHLNSLHVTIRAPLEQSIKSGTQTPGNLFSQDQHSSIQALTSALEELAQPFFDGLPSSGLDKLHPVIANTPDKPFFNASWSIRSRSGSYHSSHVHSKGWYSSACYIDVPDVINDASDAGYLLFGEPPFKTRDRLEPDHRIKPETGKLVLFPSYFWHSTKPYTGAGDRLVVAFDTAGPNLFV